MDAEDLLLRHFLGILDPEVAGGVGPVDPRQPAATTAPGAPSTAARPTCRRPSRPTWPCAWPATTVRRRPHARRPPRACGPAAGSRPAGCSPASGWRSGRRGGTGTTCRCVPPEIMFLPAWAPLNIYDFGCWARQTVVALTVVMAHRPARPLPFPLDELRRPKRPVRRRRRAEPALIAAPALRVRRRPLRRPRPGLCTRYERLPALVPPPPPRSAGLPCAGPSSGSSAARKPTGSGEASSPRSSTPSSPCTCRATRSTTRSCRPPWPDSRTSLIHDDEGRRLEACQSPVWDTALAVVALADAGVDAGRPGPRGGGCAGCCDEEVTVTGDWAVRRPGLAPGGWAFEFANDNYPDIDDTAEVVLALRRAGTDSADAGRATPPARGAWPGPSACRCRDGGWGAFDADNDSRLVAALPFCDFGEVTDPPSADVTAHVIEMLADEPGMRPPTCCSAGIAWLWDQQEPDGSWFGRWGVNYVYGTGAAVPALIAAGVPPATTSHPAGRALARRATRTPTAAGARTCAPTSTPAWRGRGDSTASQTAWALLALLAAGEAAAAVDPPRRRLAGRHPDARRHLGRAVVHRHRLPLGLQHQLPPVPPGLAGHGAGPLRAGPRPERDAAMTARPSRSCVLAPLRGRGPGRHGAKPRHAGSCATGAGLRRAAATATRAVHAAPVPPPSPWPGVAGGLIDGLAPGDAGGGRPGPRSSGADRCPAPLDGAPLVAAALRRRGLTVRVGPIVSTPHLVKGPERRASLAATGALAVDMETAALLGVPWDAAGHGRPGHLRHRRPRAAVARPSSGGGWRALGLAAGRPLPVLEEWAAAVGPRRVLLAGPRSFCAGVDRAIETVERALERYGAPGLRPPPDRAQPPRGGGPRGAGRRLRARARRGPRRGHGGLLRPRRGPGGAGRGDADRDLQVIDATCPLVAKVHHEVQPLPGSRLPGRAHRPRRPRRDRRHPRRRPRASAWSRTPTTSPASQVDDPDTAGLRHPDHPVPRRRRRPGRRLDGALPGHRRARTPPTSATPPRTARTRSGPSPRDCDLVLVVGSRNSSNTDPAGRGGRPGRLPGRADRGRDASCDLAWLRGATTVGRDRRRVGPAGPGGPRGRRPGAARSGRDRGTSRPHRTRQLSPCLWRSATNGHPPAPERQDRHLPGPPEAGPPRQVPAHRRARAAVRLQPRVQRVRQDPVPDRHPAPAADRRAGRRRHRGVPGARWSRSPAASRCCIPTSTG